MSELEGPIKFTMNVIWRQGRQYKVSFKKLVEHVIDVEHAPPGSHRLP